jgi:hypothetical protein
LDEAYDISKPLHTNGMHESWHWMVYNSTNTMPCNTTILEQQKLISDASVQLILIYLVALEYNWFCHQNWLYLEARI